MVYLSDKIKPEGSYNFYHEWSFTLELMSRKARLNAGFLYSISAGFAFGANIVWASPVTFLVGTQDEFDGTPIRN